MAQELAGKVALITGAGSGIGRATALLFAREGAKIAALGRTKEELDEVVAKIQRSGGEAMVMVSDIAKVDDMQQAMQQIEQQWGRLDIVFANAGINGVWAPIEDLEPDEWDRTMNVNLRGTFLTVKYAIPLLKRQGGSVIVTSSVNGTRIFSNTGATAYSCTKAAQVAFTQMAALELARDRIRVNVICPGAIDTSIEESTEKRGIEEAKVPVEFPEGKVPLTDGKPGKSEQVADLALFLASDRSSHITGTPVWIDGAESLIMG
ncbi:SDR family oxidoreductase [Fibrisoma montanum]|uniref:SDR family oxidoreductase n=1 Tax=Fibrisoma montanum TaxID=2305895 RepID=A0A418M2N6_9BACT|nr:SDR family NAD(P)-dependent oxidoreductase [Fibrisoma montanum]RIV19938.1 SDR family oxidoreductase [Fibrisoma montanum]